MVSGWGDKELSISWENIKLYGKGKSVRRALVRTN